MELSVTNYNYSSVFSVVSVSMKNGCIPHSIWHRPKIKQQQGPLTQGFYLVIQELRSIYLFLILVLR